MGISIICPSFDRPELCARMIKSAQATASTEVQFIVGIGSAGVQEMAYNAYCTAFDGITGNVWFAMTGQLPSVHVANMLAEKATGNLIMLCGDDTVFKTGGWDKALLEHYNALENKIHVYSLKDSRDENGTPHPVASKEYVKAMGYFFTPIFLHWHVDTWMVEIAKRNGCFTHMKDFLLAHEKPSDKGIIDNTHRRIRSNGWSERDAYTNKTCQHFLKLEAERLMK